MARDYTKYNVKGLADNLNKRKLVHTIVKDYVAKNKLSFEDVQSVFPDEVQGPQGFIRKLSDVKEAKRYDIKNPLKIKNGLTIVVSNQWGENISNFIACAEKLGYVITKETSNNTNEASETISYLEMFLRYGDSDKEVGYFSISLKSNILLPNVINFNNLIDVISWDGLYGFEEFEDAVKKETADFNLRFSDCPQIWITKMNQLDLKPLYDFRYNGAGNEEIVADILGIDKDDVNDYVDDYFSDTAYSIEM